MIYPRLMLARNLLTDDGVIFISIDDNEVHNLRKICDEVFGESNCVGQIVVKSNPRGSQSDSRMAGLHEYILVYAKNGQESAIVGHKLSGEMEGEYKYVENDRAYRLLGLRQRGGYWRRSERPNLYFPIYVCASNGKISLSKSEVYSTAVLPIQPTTGEDGSWRWSREKINVQTEELIGKPIRRNGEDTWDIFQKDYLDRGEERRTKAKSLWDEKEINYQNGTIEVKDLLVSGVFNYAKPVYLIKKCLEMLDDSDVVLDFFAGSGTTAHAVMQFNAENSGNRKYIMVQLPEITDEKSEAYKAGYKNICEMGKERIRRAGKKIEEEQKAKNGGLFTAEAAPLDTGFRVFKLDTTNMKDVYYGAGEYQQEDLFDMVSNIKEERSDIDLLYGCLLDWGVPLSLSHRQEKINEQTVHFVNETDLIACFDESVSEETIRSIARRKPLRAVFRDASFKDSADKINVTEIFKAISPETTVKVI
jgi:adenine-specific DNA-methyltransferase